MSLQSTIQSKINVYSIQAKRESNKVPIWESAWQNNGTVMIGFLRDIRYCSLFDPPSRRYAFRSLFTKDRFKDHPGASIKFELFAESLGSIALTLAAGSTALLTTVEGSSIWSNGQTDKTSTMIARNLSLPAVVTVGLGYDLQILQSPEEAIAYEEQVYPVLSALSREVMVLQNGNAAEFAHQSLHGLSGYLTSLLHRSFDCQALISSAVITSTHSLPPETVTNQSSSD